MKLCTLISNTIHLDGGSMYGHVPKTLWEKWTPADTLNRIALACRTLFFQTDDGRNFLFDVGAGDCFEPKLKDRYGIQNTSSLIERLLAIGIREHDIDGIILSHLHFDHAGGLIASYTEPPRLLFPHAKYYLSQAHWEVARHPHVREHASFVPTLNSLLEASSRLVLINNTTHPDLDCVTFSFSHGHTIGLMLSYLDLPTGLIVYASDLIPALPWVHLPVTMGYDRYPELIIDEKKRLLDTLIEKNGRILFTHDYNHECAYVNLDSKGKYIGKLTALPSM